MYKVQVNTAGGNYQINIAAGLLSELNEYLNKLQIGSRILIVSSNRLQSYLSLVLRGVRESGRKAVVLYVPEGENAKSWEQAWRIYDTAFAAGLDRSSAIIALGGGVIGDLAGFAAATYMRGIDFIQIPTTLLAQVDSSVGGKTAINHPRGKNIIGVFYQPRTVLIDTTVLNSLPQRELASGLAEIIKYGIACDYHFFCFLEENLEQIQQLEQQALQDTIAACCRLKAQIVQEDERETGVRAILNYGHTFAHALEVLTGYQEYRHGEAVALGMVIAAQLACLLGMLSRQEVNRISGLLQKANLPITLPADLNAEQLVKLMFSDKKTVADKLTLILPTHIGRVVIDRRPVDRQLLLGAIKSCCL